MGTGFSQSRKIRDAKLIDFVLMGGLFAKAVDLASELANARLDLRQELLARGHGKRGLMTLLERDFDERVLSSFEDLRLELAKCRSGKSVMGRRDVVLTADPTPLALIEANQL